MKIKKIENELEVKMMYSMKASSQAQNESLKQMFEKKQLHYEDCFIMLDDNNHLVARALVNDAYLAYVTFEKIALQDATHFIQAIQVDQKQLEFHLYSDKCHYELHEQAFMNAGFVVSMEKESYVSYPKTLLDVNLEMKVNALRDEHYIALVKQASFQHKDRMYRGEIKVLGLEQASRLHYETSIAHTDKVYRISAHTKEEAIGFVFLSELMLGVAGIGYIGVIAKQRGKGYGLLLLKMANNVALANGIYKIIADIDVENDVMRNHLLACHYTLDCFEKVFEWKR